jgi:hypothetical protein
MALTVAGKFWTASDASLSLLGSEGGWSFALACALTGAGVKNSTRISGRLITGSTLADLSQTSSKPACTANTKRLKAMSKLGLGDKSVRI